MVWRCFGNHNVCGFSEYRMNKEKRVIPSDSDKTWHNLWEKTNGSEFCTAAGQ